MRVLLKERLSPVARCAVAYGEGAAFARENSPSDARRVELTSEIGVAAFEHASVGFVDIVDESFWLPQGKFYVVGGGEVLLEVSARPKEFVTLRDARTHTPLAGWVIRPLGMSAEDRVAATDSLGRTSWPLGLVPHATFAVWDGQNALALLVLHGRSGADVQFDLPAPDRTTQIRVLDSEERPLPDARVYASSRDSGISLPVDATGQVTVQYPNEMNVEVTAPGKVPLRLALSGEKTVDVKMVDATARRFRFDRTAPREWRGVCTWVISYDKRSAPLEFVGTQQDGVMEVPSLPAEPFRCELWAPSPEGVTHYVELSVPAVEQEREVGVRLTPPRRIGFEVGKAMPGVTDLTPLRDPVWIYSGLEFECGGAPSAAMEKLRNMVVGTESIGLRGTLLRRNGPRVDLTVPGAAAWCLAFLDDNGNFGRTSIHAGDVAGDRGIALAPVPASAAFRNVRLEWDDGSPVTMSYVLIFREGGNEAGRFGYVDGAGILPVDADPGRYRLRVEKDGRWFAGDHVVVVPGAGPEVVRMLAER